MSEAEVNEKLKGDARWDLASVFPRELFCKSCRDINYGKDELLDAWHWWYDGWVQARNEYK